MDFEKAEKLWEEKDRVSAQMKAPALQKVLDEFISGHNTCALATGSGDFVRCTPVEYNYHNGSFYIFSEGGLKYRALKENSNVCLAIFDQYQGFGKLKGLQIMGKAELIEPFSGEYIALLALKKIPVDAIQKMPEPMPLIRITPVSADYLDSELKKLGYSSRQHMEY